MSLRAAIVDALKAESTVSDIVETRVSDILFEFEDMLNEPANSDVFPAISVRTLNEENENNISGHDGIWNGQFQVTLYHQIQTSNLRSRHVATKTAEETKVRSIDILKNAVVTYLNNSKGVLGSYFIRKPHISGLNEQDFQQEKNRKIIAVQIVLDVMFS